MEKREGIKTVKNCDSPFSHFSISYTYRIPLKGYEYCKQAIDCSPKNSPLFCPMQCPIATGRNPREGVVNPLSLKNGSSDFCSPASRHRTVFREITQNIPRPNSLLHNDLQPKIQNPTRIFLNLGHLICYNQRKRILYIDIYIRCRLSDISHTQPPNP
jgi:hypothetical protein